MEVCLLFPPRKRGELLRKSHPAEDLCAAASAVCKTSSFGIRGSAAFSQLKSLQNPQNPGISPRTKSRHPAVSCKVSGKSREHKPSGLELHVPCNGCNDRFTTKQTVSLKQWRIRTSDTSLYNTSLPLRHTVRPEAAAPPGPGLPVIRGLRNSV